MRNLLHVARVRGNARKSTFGTPTFPLINSLPPRAVVLAGALSTTLYIVASELMLV